MNSPRRWLELEPWLRSPARLATLVLAAAAVLAATTATQVYEFLAEREIEASWFSLFAQRGLSWLAWGLLAIPLLFVARWTAARWHWLVCLALHAVASWFLAGATVQFDLWLSDDVFERPSAFRGRGGGPGGPPPEARPDRPDGGRRGRGPDRTSLRRPREIAIYWAVLALGLARLSYLGAREKERHAADLDLRAAQLEAELARAQVDSLRGQLHPHFLFNALHTVGGLVRVGREDDALRTLSSIGGLLRSTLDRGDEDTITLRDELELAELYLEVERVRFGDRLRTELDVDDDARAALVPALVLLPLVENAVRYGVEPRAEGGVVRIEARREGADLRLDVRDDGPGFPADVLAQGAGSDVDGERRHIGLRNTRERMRVLYGDRGSFSLENPSGGGARVSLSIPLEPDGGR